MQPRRTALTAGLAALALLLGGCASTAETNAGSQPTDGSGGGDGHGRIAGASEVSEPQLGLMTIDPAGDVRHLDLLDESTAELGSVPEPSKVTTDGRYVFAADEAGVSIVDSGRWTWDHVDHFHYYRAEPRVLDRVPGKGVAAVATTNSSTTGGTGVFFPDSGEAVLLDTEALSKGDVVETFRAEVEPHDGLVVPIGSHALITDAHGGIAASVSVYDREGEPVPGTRTPCPHARGTIMTRVGAVIGCDDGALLATLDDDAVRIEHIPYPEGTTAAPATSFSGREGRPTVAALAGDDGIWLLDTRAREWMLLPAPEPLVQVTAVDDNDDHVLALTAGGRVVVLDGASGAVLAATEPLVAETLGAGTATPVLIADQQRAYLNAPAEHRLYEIDFADAGRIARTFETPNAPSFVAGTGR